MPRIDYRMQTWSMIKLMVVGIIAGVGVLYVFDPSVVFAQGPQFDVVASGLDNPRGLAFGPDGALYVAEAGRGGEGTCVPGPDGGDICFGTSGAVTRVMNGQQERIVTGLPSLAATDGSGASGPHDIAVRGNDVFVLVGLGADPAVRSDGTFTSEAAVFGTLIRLLGNGQWETIADVSAYESSANPDGGILDSNPYGLLAQADGFIVADAGGNDVLGVDSNGKISTLAVFQSRMTPAPPFLGLPLGAQMPMEPVITAVAIGPDKAIYASELTGFPFTVGEARIYRVAQGQQPAILSAGLTNIVDIAFDGNGNMYVLEIAANSLLAEQPFGRLSRVGFNGRKEIIVSEGLIMPTGMTIGSDGDIYISNCGACAAVGEVIRISSSEFPPTEPSLPSVGETAAPQMARTALVVALAFIASGSLLLIGRRRFRRA